MSGNSQVKGDPVSWLLEKESPGVRYLALRDLVYSREHSSELAAAKIDAHSHGPIASILDEMSPPGYWVEDGPGYNPKYRSTVWAIILLAQLGARIEEDERILLACNYVLQHTLTTGGHFSASGSPSGGADCLQGNLCWALSELGCTDPALDIAFEWMARSVTGEGVSPVGDRQASVRYYAGKCGPTFACGSNNRLPCAWGGTKVMLAFSKLPGSKRTPLIENAIQHGIDFFLGTDPANAEYPCGFSSKPSQNWWKLGFPVFYVTDLLQIIEAMADLGYGTDPRLATSIDLIRNKQDANGRWSLEYDYNGKTWVDFGEKKKPNKWVTLRALRMLKTISSK